MYFITLSEMFGTNGERIARQVAEKMNYAFYGEEELLKAADQTGFLSDVQKMDEKSPPLLERFFSEKPKVYLERLQSVIFEVAKKGNAVFLGRGSQLLLHSFDCALHVLVTGSMEKRIERVMGEKGVEREIAEKTIHRSDHDRGGFFRFAFNEDWLNPYLYDLILNTDKLSIDSAVGMVVVAAKSDEIKACGTDSVRLLGKLSLLRKAESALIEAGVMNPYLFVSVEDPDAVRLHGLAKSLEEKEKAEKVIKEVKDIKKVINDLALSRAYF
jgi:cytidylate kinase